MRYDLSNCRCQTHRSISNILGQLLTTDDQIALDTVMLKSGHRIRIWSSHGADGSAYVEDGLIPAANNHETGWMERCDTRWASDLNFVSSHPGAERDEIKVAQTSAER